MERKVHLINWEVVCTQKENGGLEDILWKKVIGVKYGQEGLGWRTNEAREAFGVGVWKEILKRQIGVGITLGLSYLLWQCTKMQQSARFGTLALVKEVGTSDLLGIQMIGSWILIGALFNMLRDVKISQEEDSVVWRGGGQGIFGVRHAYNLLAAPNTLDFPVRCIWVDKVPTKAAFFAWEATWGKILTLDRLQRRGWQLPNCCFLCGCEEENVNHILLHCTVARVLWDIILALFGVHWVFPETVIEVLLSWRGSFVGKRGKKYGIPYRCVFLDGLEGEK
ncbi:hypothetical protein CK203_054157 [Vitis vinifera]|uniref:Reverse transcriptase zinc-binding domain-containing protein n=1 Tax=Vitis vinifera TaxID=29760 RepID=A0A438FU65_VITVI|nr:hypothetical protein CK203_054157 [Vitis vinifera]